ncbi:uncharacterized protein N7459_009472 [Penicillium hispanicum]|uniref:uncharacterized protein n=1 Tax=Penicillium hispanicum TaxID=1080232 RepID=UPI0025409B78|nr:uncharacterized protein N7459_009472 [Penicillium hispanicum]KAJ5570042.1 hypothetical protein N7459_009472 [Penicillium hispanicum]
MMDNNRELFEYTSGRWIYNEKTRLTERHGEFNIDALKDAAAVSLERRGTDIKSLSKLAEGGFNRVLQITMLDDTQILARLPYPATEPRRLAVASEVATLTLLRSHGLPVPRVYAYSTDAGNPVGSEYIIMEKVPGKPLGARWFDLSDKQRLKLLRQLVQLEAKLHTIELPASGSIYYARDLPSDSSRIAIPDSDFCIGPSAALEWWFRERATLRIDRGPSYLKIAPELLPSKELLRPLLRHPDLQPNNIFVSDDLDIVGLIDWQHASALPLFLAAGIPKFFQNYDDPESLVFRPPPQTDLSGIDDESKAGALDVFRRRHTHFFYLAFTQRFNAPHFRAIDQPTNMLTRRVFNHAGEPWEGNNIPLQADLVLITKLWHEYATDPCPISFPSAEADSIMRQQSMQEEVDLHLKQIRNVIGIGVDGWIPPDEYEAACSRARQMKVDGLASLDTEYEREMTDRHWPFDDHNEDD